MFRSADILLLFVVFSSMLLGILVPQVTGYFRPYPLYGMMFLLFLSFLSLELSEIGRLLRRHFVFTSWLVFCKVLAFPVLVFMGLKFTFPRFAVAGLLLSGVSTGVVAPFISTLVRSNGGLVLVLVVTSSMLVPFTLPALVKFLVGRSVAISLWGMMRVLGMIVFVPIASVELMKRFTPSLAKRISRRRYAISLVIFAIINFGVFSKYGAYFKQAPGVLVSASLVAIALGGLYFCLGLGCAWRAAPEDKMASAIAAANINNVLIIVFSARFFGPLEATVAAMYMIPFFLVLFPMRAYEKFASRS
ncbi:MAG: bile acid:sodium symporter [Deltaproteobacteria bacterium]|nr:MAG: bile acid:sodium symporter [Deltaproteobacteria bacterium]